ncbi:NADH-quinone oxidoreductase subunit M [Patescibacteria group bacterium]|nr:NADH-quinone oxidoreductase subunit M [Patescibacteria group bacterium]
MNTPIIYADFPLLSSLTFLPLLTIIAVWRLQCSKLAIRAAYTGALLNFLLSVYVLWSFDTENLAIQHAEQLKFLGMSYKVGVDTTNILFIPLTALLTVLALIYTSITRHAADKTIIACLLGYEAVLIAAFAALNVLQFWFCCVLELVLVILLTLHSGTGQNRRWLVTQVLQYWASGLLMVFAGFMFLAFGLIDSEHPLTFDWLTLKQNNAFLNDEVLIFVLLFLGFAVRMPLFPFHGWLPILAEHGTVASTAIFLVGLKLGIYALLRYILPLVPGVAEQWETYASTLGLISLFYGALLALMQINMRRLLAFAVLSHTGMLVIGIFNFNVLGLEGSLLLTCVYGLATAGMLFCLGLIYEHTRTAFIPRLGALFDRHIAIAALFLLCVLSTMIMPFTPGFDAAHLLLEGIIEKNGWLSAIAILIGNVLAAAFLLRALQQIFIATSKRAKQPMHLRHASKLKELTISVIIGGLLLVAGFWSAPWLKFVHQDAAMIQLFYPLHNPPQASLQDSSNE